MQVIADNGGQLLLAVYNTITKSYLSDNKFDVKVCLHAHIYIAIRRLSLCIILGISRS